MYTLKAVKKKNVIDMISNVRSKDKDLYWVAALDALEEGISKISSDDVYTNFVIISCLEIRTNSVDIAWKAAMDEFFETFSYTIKEEDVYSALY